MTLPKGGGGEIGEVALFNPAGCEEVFFAFTPNRYASLGIIRIKPCGFSWLSSKTLCLGKNLSFFNFCGFRCN